MLSKMSFPPTYILIENVKGFEVGNYDQFVNKDRVIYLLTEILLQESDTRNTLVTQLKNCNYNFQEFFITPLQLGIPNSRLRYYILVNANNMSFFLQQYNILTICKYI